MALGRLNLAVPAAPPVPSMYPLEPLPDRVDTLPGVIFRSRWLFRSATKTVLEASTTTPVGPLKWAVEGLPSEKPGVWGTPAKVVTTAPVVIFRMQALSESAKSRL